MIEVARSSDGGDGGVGDVGRLGRLDPRDALRATQTFFAPAKLNLFLHVTGRRADGYHTLESVFQLIDFGDTLTITVRADGVIRRTTTLAGVPEESDLVMRAAHLLQQAGRAQGAAAPAAMRGAEFEATGPGAEIGVIKRIPIGGGMGGGSSDAATVLLALNRLWKLDFPRERLMELGLALGADVPFFVFGQNAFARGVGERLKALDLPSDAPPLWFVVLTPQVQVPTAGIFCAPELTRNAKSVKMADFVAGGQIVVAEPRFRNDLQPVAEAKFAQIGQALRALRAACNEVAVVPDISARMTGSGACVFAGFGRELDAQAVLTHCPAELNGRAVRALAGHPLHGWAGSSPL